MVKSFYNNLHNKISRDYIEIKALINDFMHGGGIYKNVKLPADTLKGLL